MLTGECCHIEAVSKGGARYNDTTTEDEKNSESNLVLMCSRHHTVIDSDCSTYTTDVLKQMKADHEQQFSGTKRELDEKMLFALEQSMAKYWDRLQIIDNVESDLKIKIEKDASLESLLANIEEHFSNVKWLFDKMAQFDEKLPNDVRELCNRVGVDYQQFEQVPYYENCLIDRLWELHNLAVPNNCSHLKMYYLQFCVNVFAELAKHDKAYLEECLSKITEKMAVKGFQLNEKKTRIYEASKGITFLGFIFKPRHSGKIVVTRTPEKVKAERRKLKRLVRKAAEGGVSRAKAFEHYQIWRSTVVWDGSRKSRKKNSKRNGFRSDNHRMAMRMDAYFKALRHEYWREDNDQQ